MAITNQNLYNKNNPGATNLKDRGFPSSISNYVPPYNTNLTDRGYPSSTGGYGNNSYNNSSSGSSSGSSSSGSNKVTTTTPNDYASSIAQAILAQKQAALDKAIGSVNSAYNQKRNLLNQNYNSSVNSLRNQYNNSANELQNDAAKSLKEAYINKMLTQKTLGQQLSAQGFSGGATESTMAGLHNNYGNARNNINTTLNDNLTSLNNTLQNNLATLEQNYNSALADAETARANAIAQLSLDNTSTDLSSLLSSDSTFMKRIQEALANQAAFQGTPTEAINTVSKINTEQANDMGNATQYAKYIATARELAKNPNNTTDMIVTRLYNNGLNPYEIQRVMNML